MGDVTEAAKPRGIEMKDERLHRNITVAFSDCGVGIIVKRFHSSQSQSQQLLFGC